MKLLLTSVALIGFMTTAIFLEQRVDQLKRPGPRAELMLYLPSGELLRPAALGFDTVLADVLWLRTVSYFGLHYLTDKRYDWLYHMLDVTTTLDPKFLKAYTTGALILSIELGEVEKSNRLLIKGMKHLPGQWQIPFYLGFNHFFYMNEPLVAARYLQQAAKLPGHPRFLPHLAATLLVEGGEPEAASQFLLRLYEQTKDERLREELRKRIEELKQGEPS